MNLRWLPAPGRADPAVRAGLAVLAVALAALSVREHLTLERGRQEMAGWLDGAGIEAPAGFAREPDGARLRLLAARTALSFEISPERAARVELESPEDPDGIERDRLEGAERMAETARLAGAVLAERPAAWDAAMTLGAATYLSRLQARDTHLFSAAADWEEPLAAALRLAPGKREPARFLAAAYLDVWPALSPRKRSVARGLLAEVFRNPQGLAMLLDRWLAVAADRREAFSLVPEDAAAWSRVRDSLARRRDWAAWSAAWQRGDRLLLAELDRDLAAAGERRSSGDLAGARSRYLSALARARPDLRYRGVIATALDRCPPGLVDRKAAEHLDELLGWALDRCLYGECALEPAALKRLAHLAREPRPPEEALAMLLAGDLSQASLLDRRSEDLWSETWAPYLTAKARVLSERGQAAEAEEALARVHRSWERRPLFWQARIALARVEGDTAAEALAAASLAALGREGWPATAWDWRGRTARLELLATRDAPGLAVAFDEVVPYGGAVELRLDGRSLGAFAMAPGSGSGGAPVLLVPVRVSRGLHLLELAELEGNRGTRPGAVRLR